MNTKRKHSNARRSCNTAHASCYIAFFMQRLNGSFVLENTVISLSASCDYDSS